MSSLEFLNDKAWDYPFFKKLAARRRPTENPVPRSKL